MYSYLHKIFILAKSGCYTATAALPIALLLIWN
jgi:hypothetical protein